MISRVSPALRAAAVACLIAALAVLTVVIPAHAASVADLKRSARGLPGASGAYVYDVTASKPLLNRRGTVRRILASNTKLFTAAAALDRYGADERFITALWTDGTTVGGELVGNVYLRGGGDPLFGSTDYVRKHFGSGATAEQIALLARLVGITTITGRVYGDETAWDRYRGTATYGFRRSGDIGGQLGALIFNKGFAGGRYQSDPPRYAAQRMRTALRKAGVVVKGSTGVRATPAGARPVAYVESLPMSQLSRQMNKPSNNYLAEMLVKGLAMPAEVVRGGAGETTGGAGAEAAADGDPILTEGDPATTRAGAEAARRAASKFGSRVSLGDGSGLSRSDRAAPREVVDLLRGASTTPFFTPFDRSLPIPGVDGTLHNRMRGTQASKRCRAKTGTLSNVSALSGYCTTAADHLIAFSILNNRVWPPSARTAQDRIVKTIALLD
ncbi:MAG: D-alanyl-D-alanine carboxypeptidase [Actinobacteria bacterium]|nr:D-alanyl-D-alanine carboxypeptidase [Actinomycetota bacterium]